MAPSNLMPDVFLICGSAKAASALEITLEMQAGCVGNHDGGRHTNQEIVWTQDQLRLAKQVPRRKIWTSAALLAFRYLEFGVINSSEGGIRKESIGPDPLCPKFVLLL